MIKSKKDLKYFIINDIKRHPGGSKPSIKDWLLKNEWWYIYHFLYHLRHVEYYTNCRGTCILRKLCYLYHFVMFKRLSFKLHIFI